MYLNPCTEGDEIDITYWTLTWDVFKCGFKNKNLLLICIEH